MLLFDFDGTICDDLREAGKILNALAGEFGFNPVDLSDENRLRALSSREFLVTHRISLYKLPFIVKRARKNLSARIDQLPPVAGMRETLLRLAELSIPMGIVTSNSEENVNRFLQAQGLNLFQFVFSGSSIFGKGKVLRRLIRQRGLEKEKLIYVGDETRDIEAAREAGLSVVAVTWGFNSREALQRNQPDYLADHPRDLLRILNLSSAA